MKDIFEDIKLNMITGNAKGVRNCVRQALEQEITPDEVINRGLLEGMSEITELYRSNKMYIPDLLVAVKTMDIGMHAIEKYCQIQVEEDLDNCARGVVVLGTVEGDVHDIGKNLVGMMLKNSGFKVYDLGVDVESKMFVDKAEEYGADIICLSATLTTTMHSMQKVVERLVRKRIRDNYIVMVGGAPVSQNFADRIGADIYSTNAAEAVVLATEAMKKKGQSHIPA